MIKNLMKYDLKRMLKLLVYFYAVSICLSIVTRLIFIGNDIQFIYIIGQVFLGLTISAIVSIIVNTFAHTIRVFVVNFYKDESYLTHTLPATKNQLLTSKILSALIVILLSVIVCVADILLLFYSPTLKDTLVALINYTVAGFNMSAMGFIALLSLAVLSQICAYLMMAFSAIVKGNSYNSKRGRKGLLWFVVYYLGSMAITISLVALAFAVSGRITELSAVTMMQSSFLLIIILATITYSCITIAQFFLCKKLFNKGVNID